MSAGCVSAFMSFLEHNCALNHPSQHPQTRMNRLIVFTAFLNLRSLRKTCYAFVNYVVDCVDEYSDTYPFILQFLSWLSKTSA